MEKVSQEQVKKRYYWRFNSFFRDILCHYCQLNDFSEARDSTRV